ncbi:GNAT family N-acetyltransferase [Flavobacterium sp. SM15]|uniref:lipid II:glycine glycyltransferase FemX n=1 Tax=Flavobacterium sp. SM15 TaxID=2908005 RepID=UPI001EDB0B44|nr:peptidoglycan bridge formation glycyltransferase FemA/FemB family protein [Flavobacterium sp. SM15]MCG2611250.1 GNAT family N-acetyltransferase [Flavobacterium sp. SM15]
MIDYFIVKDPKWEKKWDDYLALHPKGNHLQYSHWVKSYLSYGFDYELALAVENDKIIGGFSAVIAQKAGLKFYCISNGPVFDEASSEIVPALLELAKTAAKKRNCCCLQVVFPMGVEKDKMYDVKTFKNVFDKGNFGKVFPFVFSSSGLNWIQFEQGVSKDFFFEQVLKTNVRRDVRSAQRKEIEIKQIENPEEIKRAYELFQENANTFNYSIRAWNDFKNTIFGLIQDGKAVILGAYHQNSLKGAVFLIKAAGYYTYVMGGTKKEKPDLLLGELLQWSAIELSIEQQLKGYNISLGGSQGVMNFKNKFSPQIQLYTENSFYWVLKPISFKIYQKSLFYLKKFKPLIAKYLAN